MSITTSLRSELLKTKGTALIYFTIAAAAFAPFMSMLTFVFNGVEEHQRHDIFNVLLTTKFGIINVAIYPIFLILTCTLVPQVEYKNNTWKQVLTSPQKKLNVFIAKFINIQKLTMAFLIIHFLLMFLAAVTLHFMEPTLQVLKQSLNWNDILMARINTYVALLAMCTIQFWLGLRFKNFIIPIGIGIVLWFAGTILVLQTKSGFVEWFPYSFHAYGKFPKFNPTADMVGWTSLAFSIFFLIIGFLDFRRKTV